ncbi:MAG: fatty acid desaturase, partial [Deltaproteobacteria bacterium]
SLVTWYLGGLNFQTTHHLFPKVCHVHYPRLSRIIERVCRTHGVEYLAQPTVTRAVRSHYRFLRSLAMRPGANSMPPSSRPPQGFSLGA